MEELKERASLSQEREVCGFILDGWVVHPVDNISGADREFEMDHEQTRQAYLSLNLLGVYHSHPGGVNGPSPADMRYAPEGLRYFIVTTDEVYEWRIDGPGSAVMVDPVPHSAGQGR